MNFGKYSKMTLAVYLIIYAVYNLLIFIIFNQRNAIFWVSYVFFMLAFILHMVCVFYSFKGKDVKAAFFLVGNYIKTSPELVKRMVNEGHTVGNHTMTHPDMAAISDKESFKKELTELEALYKDAVGNEMKKLYRPPQGKFSIENLKMAKEMGYHTVFWSLAYVDWYNDDQPSREEAFDKLIPRMHSGAVVLLHSTSETNCNILDELLTKWEDMGYTFGDINELTGT